MISIKEYSKAKETFEKKIAVYIDSLNIDYDDTSISSRYIHIGVQKEVLIIKPDFSIYQWKIECKSFSGYFTVSQFTGKCIVVLESIRI